MQKGFEQETTYRIAIIGGGPKGTYGFERLAAHLAAHPVNGPVDIHIFNRTPHFGSGDVYRTDQPDYLLINFCIGNINMWINEEPPAVVPDPLPLTTWLQEKHRPPLPLNNLDYAPRAVVGRYLEAGFQAIAAHLPGHVNGQYIVGEVIDIRPEDSSYRLVLRTEEGHEREMPEAYQRILLATGHPRPSSSPEHEPYAAFCKEHLPCTYVPFIYPVSEKLRDVPAGKLVAMKGMGLTFVDAALALTEGRGGRFYRDQQSAKLVYHASGEEPACLFPFSRSGLPMLPRGPSCGPSQTPLCVFTRNAIEKLRRASSNGVLDFETDLWPLLQWEMSAAYYRVLFRQHSQALDIPNTNPLSEATRHLHAQINAFHQQHLALPKLDAASFLDPLADTERQDPQTHHRFVVAYLQTAIAEAQQGEVYSPWMAVAAVWREATPLFGEIFRFGGLTPASQRAFATHYHGPLSRITFGPPIESMEKIVALAEAGLLNFSLSRAATVTSDATLGRFLLHSDFTASHQAIHHLVDARIPKMTLPDAGNTLYRNLLRRGLARPFENRSEQHAYHPGCLALTEEGNVIDAQGQPNPALTATGTPTEGITYDNDSLSRTRNNFVSAWAARVRQDIETHYPTHAATV